MIYANIVLTANDEKDVPQLREWLKEQGRLSRMEPGCLRFEVYHSTTDPKVFLLVERWESAEPRSTCIARPRPTPRSTNPTCYPA